MVYKTSQTMNVKPKLFQMNNVHLIFVFPDNVKERVTFGTDGGKGAKM